MQDFNVKLNAQDIYTIKDALNEQMDLWQQRIDDCKAENCTSAAETAQYALDYYKRIIGKLDEASLENIGIIIELK